MISAAASTRLESQDTRNEAKNGGKGSRWMEAACEA